MGERMTRDSGPPHLIFERGYWLCPVQVFGGMTWFIIGLLFGILIGVFAIDI